jgi:hypothetical protein
VRDLRLSCDEAVELVCVLSEIAEVLRLVGYRDPALRLWGWVGLLTAELERAEGGKAQ